MVQGDLEEACQLTPWIDPMVLQATSVSTRTAFLPQTQIQYLQRLNDQLIFSSGMTLHCGIRPGIQTIVQIYL